MKTLTIDYAVYERIRNAVKGCAEGVAEQAAEREELKDGEWLWARGGQVLSEQCLWWVSLIEKLGEVKEEE